MTCRGRPAVARLVGDDAQQPWPDWGPGTKAWQGGERFDEGDLRGIFRFVRIPNDDIRDTKGKVLIAPDKRLDGVAVPAFRSLHEC
ncbi:MAG: hypothetical protein KatS3mg059_1576 [Thermomicrobiales bacterium]|nr:MAG: hypothetical protein KatS3mg059_1576 [Thermomicrobiales bacterium]